MSVSLNDKPNKVYSSGDTVTVTAGSGIQGPQGATGATGAGGAVAYFGNFFSTETQNNAGATVASTFTLNSTVDANGISIVDSTKITFAAGSDGTYDLQFSVQFDKTDSGTDEVDVWLSKNGNYEVWSNTTLSLVGNNAKVVAAWNFQLNDVVGGDYFQLHWWSPDTAVRALAAAAGSSPTRPAVPSIIVTVAQVTYTQAGATGATGPQGPAGDPGPQGDQGIAVQGTAPANTTILWADTSAAGSMVVPAGGTTGQALTKNSNDDYDTEWTTITAGIPETLIDAKGDLIVGSAADTAARLAVGTNGHVLVADSSATGGMKWSEKANFYWYVASGTPMYGLPGYMPTDPSILFNLDQNTDFLFVFEVPRPIVIDQIACEVTTGSVGNLRLGLTAVSDALVPTGAPLEDSGDISTAASGVKAFSLATARRLEPGLYATCINKTGSAVIRLYRARPLFLGVPSTMGANQYNTVLTGARTYAAFPTPIVATPGTQTGVMAGGGPTAFAFIRVSDPNP